MNSREAISLDGFGNQFFEDTFFSSKATVTHSFGNFVNFHVTVVIDNIDNLIIIYFCEICSEFCETKFLFIVA